MALLVCVLVAVVLTAGFSLLGMMWISVALRRLLRDGRQSASGLERRPSAEPAE